MKPYVHVHLAWWHSYKHASLMLFRDYAATLFAPLSHHLWPDVQFYIKPKRFTHVEGLLTILRLCTKELLPQIDSALASVNLETSSRNQLENLKTLLMFFIPSVSHLLDTK